MTQSIDNSEWVMPGVIRDPITGALMRVNADGSINVSIAGGGAGAGTGFSGTNISGTVNTAGISLSVASPAAGIALYDGANSISTGTVRFTNANGVSFTFNGQTISGSVNTSYRASNDALGLNTAGSNVTWTANSSGVSIDARGYAGTGTSATNASVTMNSAGLALNVPFATISSYENTVVINTSFDPTAQSYCVPFNLPQAGSFSFIRVIASFTNITTTAATTGQTANVSGAIYSTWNAVVYSLGTGASSASLTAVQSGSLGITDMNSMSVAVNGTQYTFTMSYAYGAQGGSTQNFTTSGAVSQTNYSFSSNQLGTIYSGNRVFDIPFAVSLSPGPYWLILGGSTSSNTNSTFYTFLTQRNGSLVSMYGGNTVSIISVKPFANPNATSVIYGAAVFSTVGGGTTANLPISALSTTASNPKLYFQMLRSA